MDAKTILFLAELFKVSLKQNGSLSTEENYDEFSATVEMVDFTDSSIKPDQCKKGIYRVELDVDKNDNDQDLVKFVYNIRKPKIYFAVFSEQEFTKDNKEKPTFSVSDQDIKNQDVKSFLLDCIVEDRIFNPMRLANKMTLNPLEVSLILFDSTNVEYNGYKQTYMVETYPDKLLNSAGNKIYLNFFLDVSDNFYYNPPEDINIRVKDFSSFFLFEQISDDNFNLPDKHVSVLIRDNVNKITFLMDSGLGIYQIKDFNTGKIKANPLVFDDMAEQIIPLNNLGLILQSDWSCTFFATCFVKALNMPKHNSLNDVLNLKFDNDKNILAASLKPEFFSEFINLISSFEENFINTIFNSINTSGQKTGFARQLEDFLKQSVNFTINSNGMYLLEKNNCDAFLNHLKILDSLYN